MANTNYKELWMIVRSLCKTAKTKTLRDAGRKLDKGNDIPGYVTLAGNRKIISATIFDNAMTVGHRVSGVVIAQCGKELKFNNLDELIEAEKTADAIYHYRRSFFDYDCSAGL